MRKENTNLRGICCFGRANVKPGRLAADFMILGAIRTLL